MRRVVVTGLGAVTPIGNNVKDMWESVEAGKCGIAPITHYDTTGRKVCLAGEVKDFHPEEYVEKSELRKMDPFTQFALAAAGEAMADSGLDMEKEDALRCGIIFSAESVDWEPFRMSVPEDWRRGLIVSLPILFPCPFPIWLRVILP